LNKSKIPHPLKYPGGKSILACGIIELMPHHLHYVEPYFGGGAVLLEKDPHGISEVVNDLRGDLTNFWQVLQSPEQFGWFSRRLAATPFSEAEFHWTIQQPDDIDRAIQFFIRCRQSRAGSGTDFAPLSRNRTRRGMNEQASAWWSAVDGLEAVHQRLARVVILNRNALDVIRQQDGPSTLYYCDPPYLLETRTCPDHYAHEMTDQQHGELLDLLANVGGSVLISGYRSELYDRWAEANGFTRIDFDVANSMAQGPKTRRIECVWKNF
jgi:DNA adenine methylase